MKKYHGTNKLKMFAIDRLITMANELNESEFMFQFAGLYGITRQEEQKIINK